MVKKKWTKERMALRMKAQIEINKQKEDKDAITKRK